MGDDQKCEARGRRERDGEEIETEKCRGSDEREKTVGLLRGKNFKTLHRKTNILRVGTEVEI